MTLGVILAIGESWEDFEKKGQDSLFLKNNLKQYSTHFDRVYLFSYGACSKKLLPNVFLIPNIFRLNRFIYAFLLPIMHLKLMNECDVIRGYQLTSIIPGLIVKILLRKSFLINYGYDYIRVAKIEGQRFRQIVLKILEKFLIYANVVIVTTNSLQIHLKDKLDINSVMIPNSIDSDIFRPIKMHKKYDILYVGRLEKQKNLDLLLKACTRINKKHRSLRILFIGQGSMNSDLIKMSKRLRLDLKVIPTIKNDHLPKYFNTSKLFVLVSKVEGLPKALLEAMSCGLPVLGSNVEGINNLIIHKSNGWLVNTTDTHIADAIEILLHSVELRKELGHSAMRFVKSHFDSKHVWKKEILLLKQLSN